MSFGPYLLPSSRRVRHEELERYVRNEYREDNTCWFTAENGHGPCVKLPGEMARAVSEDKLSCSEQVRPDGATGCPVLNAISKARPITDGSTRVKGNGRP